MWQDGPSCHITLARAPVLGRHLALKSIGITLSLPTFSAKDYFDAESLRQKCGEVTRRGCQQRSSCAQLMVPARSRDHRFDEHHYSL